MKPLALVPAKAYSERLPRKNLRLLAGKPLLAWTLEAAFATGIFADVWVSSESDEVLDVARDYGARALRRPAELVLPGATVSHVILHARQALEWSGPLSILIPSSPFRSALTLAAAWQSFGTRAALLSVRPLDHPPEWAFRMVPITGELRAVVPQLVDAPRSALERAYRHDGSHFLLGPANREGTVHGFEVDPIEAVDINTAEDLDYAEYLLDRGRVPWISRAIN